MPALIKGRQAFGNSYALIADAIESTTDIFASFLVLFGIKYSSRPADKTTHMDTVVQNL
jgi:divalent metal cation (Fe/Co/Zn/Cd) transporter